jgi:glycosyltransferase involved in cell wall biosynthesis
VWFVKAGSDLFPADKKLIDELNLGGNVRFVGNPGSDEDLAGLYHMADVFAFPSIYEGFGWPPLEAMACGIPVVASSAGSLPEVLGDAALFVNAHDVMGLAEAIGRCLGDGSLRSELISRGLNRAAAFKWARTADKTIEVYRRVLATNGISAASSSKISEVACG